MYAHTSTLEVCRGRPDTWLPVEGRGSWAKRGRRLGAQCNAILRTFNHVHVLQPLEIQEIELFKPPRVKTHLLFLPTEYMSSLFYHGAMPSLKCLLEPSMVILTIFPYFGRRQNQWNHGCVVHQPLQWFPCVFLSNTLYTVFLVLFS